MGCILKDIEDLLAIMRSLRDKQTGCPWDLRQTHHSLANYVLEEAYEVVAAIDDGDPAALCGELGDLLFQIVFHAQLAVEQQQFDFSDVVNAICSKMRQRHPHVFDTKNDDNAHKATPLKVHNKVWENLKQQQKPDGPDASILAGIAGTLPAITRSMKLQKRAASVGFDWKSITPIFAKVTEELEEVRVEVDADNSDAIEDEIGDLFFAVINLARHADVDPESALRRSNRKFEQRFRHLESLVQDQQLTLTEMSESQLEHLWGQVKQREFSP